MEQQRKAMLDQVRSEMARTSQGHLDNRRSGMKKQGDAIALLELLYHDETHLTLPAHTRHRTMRIVLDTLAESQRIFTDGERAIALSIVEVVD